MTFSNLNKSIIYLTQILYNKGIASIGSAFINFVEGLIVLYLSVIYLFSSFIFIEPNIFLFKIYSFTLFVFVFTFSSSILSFIIGAVFKIFSLLFSSVLNIDLVVLIILGEFSSYLILFLCSFFGLEIFDFLFLNIIH